MNRSLGGRRKTVCGRSRAHGVTSLGGCLSTPLQVVAVLVADSAGLGGVSPDSAGQVVIVSPDCSGRSRKHQDPGGNSPRSFQDRCLTS
jgi:hypothetical protein